MIKIQHVTLNATTHLVKLQMSIGAKNGFAQNKT